MFVYGSTRLNGGSQNILDFEFAYNPSGDRYEFSAAPRVGAVNIEVESVTALHWTDQRYVPRPPLAPPLVLNQTTFNQMTGIQLSGKHPMVTTQFTGCAFCMAEHSGKMYCAHVSPSVPGKSNNTEGPLLGRRVIQTSGAFANAGGARVRVYGRNAGHPPNRAGYNIGPIGTLGVHPLYDDRRLARRHQLQHLLADYTRQQNRGGQTDLLKMQERKRRDRSDKQISFEERYHVAG